MAARNPFSPSFETSPPVLAERDAILDSVGDALATGPTHPDYTALFIGVRGAGKTVMLNAVEDLAGSRGWLALSDDATTFLQRCSCYDIDRLSTQATRRAIAEPINEHGHRIDSAALDRAVAATSGLDVRPVGKLTLPLAVGVDGLPAVVEPLHVHQPALGAVVGEEEVNGLAPRHVSFPLFTHHRGSKPPRLHPPQRTAGRLLTRLSALAFVDCQRPGDAADVGHPEPPIEFVSRLDVFTPSCA